ncbi:MAG: SAM-dependent methyltransferase [Lachnospiraceae bacterium]|nr:SAM-dependent methyltransferase [Lachnospiraceae bacterium]
MEKLLSILNQCLNETLVQVILSNRRKSSISVSKPAANASKSSPNARRKPAVGKKTVIRPFLEKEELLFQFAEYRDNQVFHSNRDKEETLACIENLLKESYKQIEIWTEDCQYSALVNRQGKAAIRRHAAVHKKLELPQGEISRDRLSHNRKKAYILPESTPIPFLQELGVQTKEGKIIDKKYKKFRQINRFLEFVRDVLPALPKDRKLTILDFGCGKSYLTFAMYYYLKIMEGYDVSMTGLDLKTDVIARCNQLAEKFGYEDLHFLQGDIQSYEGARQVDMVVTLHACDTATDFALGKAVDWDAKVILSVPCCQHEMNRQLQGELLQPVMKYGILKERMAALITDGLRANLLEQQGYEVQLLEFIDMEHTPKNILIRAVKSGKRPTVKTEEAYRRLCDTMNLHGTLEKLLEETGLK